NAGTGGILLVSDGTHTANLQFAGDYQLANFEFLSDGSGGTLVTDPPTPLPPSFSGVTPLPPSFSGVHSDQFVFNDSVGVIKDLGAALDEFLPNQFAGAQQTVLDILSHAAQAAFEAVAAPDCHAGS